MVLPKPKAGTSSFRLTTCENGAVLQSGFWHPPAWKWVLALALFACSILLAFQKPSGSLKVELLPFPDSPLEWNESYPYLIVSPIDAGSEHPKFESCILIVRPTVHHVAPINEFQVDLHSEMFVLRQTDLFIADTTLLSLTRTYRDGICPAGHSAKERITSTISVRQAADFPIPAWI
jgi:hypothetical protein